MKPPLTGYSLDDYQTPPEALLPLIPYLNNDWIIWECAEGQGKLSRSLKETGFQVEGSDILTGQDLVVGQFEFHRARQIIESVLI